MTGGGEEAISIEVTHEGIEVDALQTLSLRRQDTEALLEGRTSSRSLHVRDVETDTRGFGGRSSTFELGDVSAAETVVRRGTFT